MHYIEPQSQPQPNSNAPAAKLMRPSTARSQYIRCRVHLAHVGKVRVAYGQERCCSNCLAVSGDNYLLPSLDVQPLCVHRPPLRPQRLPQRPQTPTSHCCLLMDLILILMKSCMCDHAFGINSVVCYLIIKRVLAPDDELPPNGVQQHSAHALCALCGLPQVPKGLLVVFLATPLRMQEGAWARPADC